MVITFKIPGVPKGKGRPRFAKVGNYVSTYTPKETVIWENLVRTSFREVHAGPPTDQPVQMWIRAFFPPTKSWSKKRLKELEEQAIPYTHKSDVDNIAKSIADSLNKIAYCDDAQIYSLLVTKYYDLTPQTIVTIEY